MRESPGEGASGVTVPFGGTGGAPGGRRARGVGVGEPSHGAGGRRAGDSWQCRSGQATQPRRQALEFLRAKVGHQKVSSPQVTGSALPLGRPVAAGPGLGFPWGREAVGATTAWAWPLAVGGGGRIRPRRGMWEAERLGVLGTWCSCTPELRFEIMASKVSPGAAKANAGWRSGCQVWSRVSRVFL